MRYLSLAALKLALTDLFANRLDVLLGSNAGKMYEPMLRKKKEAIDALPESLVGGKPLADALTEADNIHDGFAAAIWHMTEAYLRWPSAPAGVHGAIERVRQAFIPDLAVTRATYVEEAHAAMDNKVDLPKLEADLKMIPVAGNLSLYDWCSDFIAAGESIGTLLAQRADIHANSRGAAGKLRTSTLGLLNRLRVALADEMGDDEKAAADFDGKIFGYFDELARMRETSVQINGRDEQRRRLIQNLRIHVLKS